MHIFLFVALILTGMRQVLSLECFKCNESRRTQTSNCLSQTLVNCPSLRTTAGKQSKMLCRTTRTKSRPNTFAITKECVTEDDHLARYTDGKGFGCESIYVSEDQELTYCVCDYDACNERDMDRQREEDARLDAFLDTGDNGAGGNGQIKFLPAPTLPSALNRYGSQIPSVHSDRVQRISNNTLLLPPHPLSISPQGQHQLDLSNSQISRNNRIDRTTQLQQKSQFTCQTCQETVPQSIADCRKQTSVDCAQQLNILGTNYGCLSVEFLSRTGERRIEKRCVTESMAENEIGVYPLKNTCGEASGPNAFSYCLCASPSCNSNSLLHQRVLFGKAVDGRGVAPAGQTFPSLVTTSNAFRGNATPVHCFVCGEADANIAECTQQYRYDCSRQYQPEDNDKILCLTRKTKSSNGLNYIEKRCIVQSEHEAQYPGNKDPLLLDGCGQAWGGYVEYCVCKGNLCNGRSVGQQQISAGFKSKLTNQNETSKTTNKQTLTTLAPSKKSSETSQTSQKYLPNDEIQKETLTEKSIDKAEMKPTFSSHKFSNEISHQTSTAANIKSANLAIDQENNGATCLNFFQHKIFYLVVCLVLAMFQYEAYS